MPGPIPRDHITTYEGLEISKYGCAMYPVVALSRLLSSDSRVIAVTHVRKIDVLKMNLEEAGCCWYRNEYQPEELEKVDELPLDELPKFASHCLDHGVKADYITLDEYGCVVYCKDPEGKLQEHFVKRVLVENVADTKGCDDSFAGGLAFGLLKTGDCLSVWKCHGCAKMRWWLVPTPPMPNRIRKCFFSAQRNLKPCLKIVSFLKTLRLALRLQNGPACR